MNARPGSDVMYRVTALGPKLNRWTAGHTGSQTDILDR
jgi:hypothetical protein